MPSLLGLGCFFGFTGIFAASALSAILQVCCNGHCPQRGIAGIQMRAPKSMMAWAKSECRSSGASVG